MNRKIIPVGPINANCVLLWEDPAAVWVVDPGADGDKIIAALAADGLTPAFIAFTHGHFDHIGATPALLAKWPALPVHLAPADVPLAFVPENSWTRFYPPTPRPDTLAADLTEGAVLSAGGLSATVLATPGHTPGSVCFHFADAHLLLSGDTLFPGSCGRTDFPGGDARVLSASLKRLAADIPPDTDILPGHGAPTGMAHELATNPFLKA